MEKAFPLTDKNSFPLVSLFCAPHSFFDWLLTGQFGMRNFAFSIQVFSTEKQYFVFKRFLLFIKFNSKLKY